MKNLIILLLMFAPLFSLGQNEKKISKKPQKLNIVPTGFVNLNKLKIPCQISDGNLPGYQ